MTHLGTVNVPFIRECVRLDASVSPRLVSPPLSPLLRQPWPTLSVSRVLALSSLLSCSRLGHPLGFDIRLGSHTNTGVCLAVALDPAIGATTGTGDVPAWGFGSSVSRPADQPTS
ncbi:unnamed protein product [Protopolystoma xenopodis]|uniref:Uncharacterized protein n=1 Tax=Protopolystoma xenopodis TaxID=117903 RepID=A0A3S5ATB7_9PLAT|nr:unnamed protein product [Protopolystoma xenopodis]